MRCLFLILVASLAAQIEAQTRQNAPDLVREAGHCVATAQGDWFGLSPENPYELELGISGDEGNSESDSIYLIDFTAPTHSQGYAFAFESRGRGSHRELTLEFRTRFQQADDGTQRVSLVDPPVGGIRSNAAILAAIQKVGFHTWRVPVAELRGGSGVSCVTANALQ